MKNRNAMITVGILVFVGFCSCAKEEHTQEPMRRIQKLPDSFAFATASELADLPSFWRASVLWPTQTQIKDQRMPLGEEPVKRAVDDTMRYLAMVLQDKWVPDRSDVDVLPLKGALEGYDAVRLRYECEGYAFQVTSTSSGIMVLIGDRGRAARKRKVDQDQARTYVSSVLDKFFRESDKIKGVSMDNLKEKNNIVTGYPAVKGRTSIYWWGLVSWWTDGSIVQVGAGKADGGAWLRELEKDWFSEKKNKTDPR